MKYAWIDEHRGLFTLAAMCRCLGTTRQAYNGWKKREDDDESDRILVLEILDIMKETRSSYGIKRVAKELKDRGFHVNHKRVERLMKENNIKSRRPKKRKKTTDSNHSFPASEDRLKRRFNPSRPNQVWASDITYLKTRDGWLYLCVWMDLFSRKLVGWSISSSLAAGFVCDALSSALTLRPGAKPVVHSDRGVQYACHEFRLLLWRNKLKQSMSRKGDCWDNAVVESFFGTLKTELDLSPSVTSREARQLVFEYIEIFYNRKRLHSTLGYKSPEEVERLFWSLSAVS